METGLPEFHWRNGVYFRRELNGDVTITQHATVTHSPPRLQITIPSAEWCSIIAHVSRAAIKDAQLAYEMAQHLHEGPFTPPHPLADDPHAQVRRDTSETIPTEGVLEGDVIDKPVNDA